ncbi:YqiA/YcfP family alpha/beta fold hydrolase [Polynucleobacter sp. MWH-CaK5]|uniref:YqiA/YcfP family alpha/beta fold hydrolase n=1 Tax=Polynucleobacter sp. MWH-CaK5 TaxID=2689107 RepID=UPI0035305205
MHLFVYLHGFKSSPNSNKAQLTKAAIEQRIELGEQITWYCPQLPASPREAIEMVRDHIGGQTFSTLSFMGSSLGGYYATHLAEQFPSRISLLNPAIEPARDLEKYIGEQKSWHQDEVFHFLPEYIQELQDIYVKNITQAERYFLLAAIGDEVLDWREMVSKYPGAQQLILEGGDHAISDYPNHLNQLMDFHFTSFTHLKPT